MGNGNRDLMNLEVGTLDIVERCLLMCPHCGIKAKPNGPMMEWDLLNGILGSEKIKIIPPPGHDRVFLGNGEPLLYMCKKNGLAAVVTKLLEKNPCLKVEIISAGLLPQNMKFGRMFFEQLEKLPEEMRTRLIFHMSFNHLHRFDPKVYFEAKLETLKMVAALKLSCKILATCPANDPHETDLLNRQVAELTAKFGAIETQMGFIEAVGEVIAHKYDKSKCVAVSTDPKICENLANNRHWYAIRANGDVRIECWGFGGIGATIGNVLENDAMQIKANHAMMARELEQHLRGVPPKDRCEAHRTWGKRFIAPRATIPLVRI